MKMVSAIGVGVAAVLWALPAFGQDLRLEFAGGRVTLEAKNVTLQQILQEWARLGDTKIVNGDKLTGGPVTLQLHQVPEIDALDTLLRSAAGFLAAPRPAGQPGASHFDRVLVLATSAAPSYAPQALTPAQTPDVTDDVGPDNPLMRLPQTGQPGSPTMPGMTPQYYPVTPAAPTQVPAGFYPPGVAPQGAAPVLPPTPVPQSPPGIPGTSAVPGVIIAPPVQNPGQAPPQPIIRKQG